MSDEEGQAEGQASGPKKKKPLMLLVLLVCGVAGAGAGGFVAAPILLGGEPAAEGTEGETPAPSSRATRETPSVIYSVDNMVLNPAGSNGIRFLMVTAAFELGDSKTAELMRTRDAEVRDILMEIFGQRSVEELADLRSREQLRDEVKTVMEERLQTTSIRRVYLPQFVIQ